MTRLDRVGYGASRATFIADLQDGRSLVARVDTGDGPMAATELSLAREAEVYRALQGTLVRIPALHAVAPGGTALLVDRAPGSHVLDDLDEEHRLMVFADYVDALADLHNVDPAGLSLPSYRRPSDPAAHALDELDLWETILDDRTVRPWALARYTIAFLRQAAPAQVGRTVLCHGDVGPGNFMHDGSRVTALLDWEFSHLGDPMDDLAWWVFRGHDMAGRCGDLSGQLRRWRARTELPVDRRSIDYYRIFVMLRWLISVAAALEGGAGGMDRSVYFGLVPVLSVRLPLAMASYLGVDLGAAPAAPSAAPGPAAEVISALTADLDGVIGPSLDGSEPRRRLAAAHVYLSHLSARDSYGPELDAGDLDDAAQLLGHRPRNGTEAAQAVTGLVARAGARPEALPYLWRAGRRQADLWPAVRDRATTLPTTVPDIS